MGEFGTAKAVVSCFDAMNAEPKNKRCERRYYRAIKEYAKKLGLGVNYNYWQILDSASMVVLHFSLSNTI